MNIMEATDIKGLPDWLSPLAERLDQLLAGDRVPHALLLHGQPGVGRNLLAHSFARRLLALPDDPGAFVHPDCLRVEPDADKAQIAVVQVRALVDFMTLTASTRRKVAVVSPAETLSVGAANALLKTLEEPAGSAVLVLVVDSPRRLPATIVSRCQRLRVPTPEGATAGRYLDAHHPGVDWAPWLDLAGGGPFAALDLHQRAGDDGAAFLATLPADLVALVRREDGPVPVARRWAKGSLELALRWLEACVRAIIARHFGVGRPLAGLPAALQKPEGGPNIPAWFGYLDRVQRVRRQLDRGLNEELQVADLLLWWATPGAARRPT